MKKNIAVMCGGPGAEAGISLKSGDIVCQYLDKEKYNVYKVLIEEHNWVAECEGTRSVVDKNDFSVVIAGSKVKFDAVFIAIHGTPAEDGRLQGYLDMMGIPYNCCGVMTAAITFDKSRTKEYLRPFGILSAQSVVAKRDDDRSQLSQKINQELTYPLFVKPNKNGSSYGASKVDTADALDAAIRLAFDYDDEILAEEYIKGTEVTCGVIRYEGKVTALPLTEIRSKNAFFDYQAKYEGHSREVTPAEIDPTIAQKIQATSAAIYEKLDFKGMCRIDYILRDGQYYMLEVNSVPGLSAESIVPQQARAFGLTLTELFGNSIDACLSAAKADYADIE
ncbi:MAG: D-alanine--D-alanine ligase [Bacteroidetes bacterium]|nr:D-alanine--D-alanine ligase [Bacteroidota bacterium]